MHLTLGSSGAAPYCCTPSQGLEFIFVAAPWTQLLEIRWRPALTFYEKRTELRRCLADDKLLEAFRVDTDHVDARLTKPGHALRVRQDGLILEILGQGADADLGWSCVVAALERIKPENMIVGSRYQHLEELDAPFEVVVKAARDRFLVSPDGEEIEDWALVVNLPRSATAELGIIREVEAIPRLTRSVGGMSSARVQDAPSFWHGVQFPGAALFVDSHWPGSVVGANPDEAHHAWAVGRDRANDLTEHLLAKLAVAV
jgi:hypothetical protein